MFINNTTAKRFYTWQGLDTFITSPHWGKGSVTAFLLFVFRRKQLDNLTQRKQIRVDSFIPLFFNKDAAMHREIFI